MSRLHWHPKTGEAREFADNESEPAGWLDHHPDDEGAVDAGDDGVLGTSDDRLTKKEVIDALTEAGVQFNARDNLATLTELLDKTVAEVLAHNSQEAPAGTTLRQRLDMVRSS